MSVLPNANNLAISGGQFTANDHRVTVHNTRVMAPKFGKIRAADVVNILHAQIAEAGLLHAAEQFDAPKCDPDTRRGIIESLATWVNAGDSSSLSAFFWLHGPAGVGKSAIGQEIAILLLDKRNHAGSFFFSRTSVGRNNGNALIATLAYQLAMYFPPIRVHIAKNLKRNPGIFALSNKIQMQKLIIEPVNQTRKSLSYYLKKHILPGHWTQPRLMLIDGLDECDNPEIQSDLLMAIGLAVHQLRMPFRFIIASRPEAHILSTLKHEIFQAINYTQMNLGEDVDADRDVRTFLLKEFQKIRADHPLGKHLPEIWPTPADVDQLVRKSSSNFIYPSTVIKYIKSPQLRPDECLKIILGLSMKPSDDRPYALLDDLYNHIFTATFSAHKPSIKRIFDILVIPRSDDDGLGIFTTPALLEKLLSFPNGHVEHVLGNLLCLVSLNGRDKPIKVLHASLSDFLLDPSRSGNFFADASLAHIALAQGYVNEILEKGIYLKNITSANYNLAVRHSDKAFQEGIPKHEAYASLDQLHEHILRTTPTIRIVINVILVPWTDNGRARKFTNIDMLQKLLPAHPGYVKHVLDALPYLFDVNDKYINCIQPSFSKYLLDSSRSGELCADIAAGQELIKKGYDL